MSCAQLRIYFPGTDDHALPPVHLPISEQESLIEIATSGSVKIEFNQKPLPDFWIGLRSEYPALANHAVNLWDMWDASVPLGQKPEKMQSAKFK